MTQERIAYHVFRYTFQVISVGLFVGSVCYVLNSPLGFLASAGFGAAGALLHNIGYDVWLSRKQKAQKE